MPWAELYLTVLDLGYGIIAKENISKDSFVCEYRGKLRDACDVHPNLKTYVYEFEHFGVLKWYVWIITHDFQGLFCSDLEVDI